MTSPLRRGELALVPTGGGWGAGTVVPLVLVAIVLAALPGRSSADTVVLKNGNEIQGEILEETPQRLTVRFIGGTLYLNRRDVGAIRRESRLEYLLQQGETSLRRQDAERAIEIYKKASEEDPGSAAARQGLLAAEERYGGELEGTGRYREAIEVYERLAAREPDHPRARTRIEAINAALRRAALEEAAGVEALRQGRVAEALELLRRIYERFPDRRPEVGPPLAAALIQSGDRQLAAGKLVEAEEAYLEAVSLDPDLAPAMENQFAYARARRLAPLVERSEWRKLLPEVEEALKVTPRSPLLSYLRGVCLQALGKTREAAEIYLRISGDKPPADPRQHLDLLRRGAEVKIAALLGARPEPESDPRRSEVLSGDYRALETEHFTVRHRNATIAQEVAEAAEAAYALLHQELRCEGHWVKRCAITLFPELGQFRDSAGNLAWAGGFHRIRRRFGALADHEIFSWQLQPRLSGAVIPHEVAHAMLASRVGYEHEVPLWLNEGFAIHWEPQYVHRYHHRVAAHAARARTLIPMGELLGLRRYPEEEEQVKLFYAQSHTLVEVLLDERKLEVWVDFARELAASPDSLERLLERYYRIRGLKALEARWMARLLN